MLEGAGHEGFPNRRCGDERFCLLCKWFIGGIPNPDSRHECGGIANSPEVVRSPLYTWSFLLTPSFLLLFLLPLQTFIARPCFCRRLCTRECEDVSPVLIGTRLGVTQDGGNLIGNSCIEDLLWLCLGGFEENIPVSIADAADARERQGGSHTRERTVATHHLEERGFPCSNAEWPTVIEDFSLLSLVFSFLDFGVRHSHMCSELENGLLAACEEEGLHRGNIAGGSEGATDRKGSPKFSIEVLRFVLPKFRRDVVEDRSRSVAILECCCVGEGLKTRSRLSGDPCHINFPSVGRIIEIGISDVCEDLSLRHIDRHECRIKSAVDTRDVLHGVGDHPLRYFLEFPVEGGFDAEASVLEETLFSVSGKETRDFIADPEDEVGSTDIFAVGGKGDVLKFCKGLEAFIIFDEAEIVHFS